MQKEQIREFTLRISQGNKSEIIVVLFDVLRVYLEAAEKASSYEKLKEEIRNAQAVIYDLRKSLNRKYEIAVSLDSLYSYWYKTLEMAVVKNDNSNIPAVKRMTVKIRDAFDKAAQTDDSAPAMSNTEKVYAGLTYGRGALSETTDITGGGRGFLA